MGSCTTVEALKAGYALIVYFASTFNAVAGEFEDFVEKHKYLPSGALMTLVCISEEESTEHHAAESTTKSNVSITVGGKDQSEKGERKEPWRETSKTKEVKLLLKERRRDSLSSWER